jgi:hypothetical protein
MPAPYSQAIHVKTTILDRVVRHVLGNPGMALCRSRVSFCPCQTMNFETYLQADSECFDCVAPFFAAPTACDILVSIPLVARDGSSPIFH